MKLWGCIQFDLGYCKGYFSTSGRNLKTGSWLFCHENHYVLVLNFTVSNQKVISSQLGYLSKQVKTEIPVKTGSFRKFKFMTSHIQYTCHMTPNVCWFFCWFTAVKIFELHPRKFQIVFSKMRGWNRKFDWKFEFSIKFRVEW